MRIFLFIAIIPDSKIILYSCVLRICDSQNEKIMTSFLRILYIKGSIHLMIDIHIIFILFIQNRILDL